MLLLLLFRRMKAHPTDHSGWFNTKRAVKYSDLSRTSIYSLADFVGGPLRSRLVVTGSGKRGKRLWSKESIDEYLNGSFCSRCGVAITNENLGGTDDKRARFNRSQICEECVDKSNEGGIKK